jgi:hypothetical protein
MCQLLHSGPTVEEGEYPECPKVSLKAVSLYTDGNVLPVHHSLWALCIMICTSVDHWRSTLKECDGRMKAEVTGV